MNAKEIYELNDRNGKAPGQWLGLKSTKKLLSKGNDDLYYNKVNEEYVFSELLLKEYEKSFNNSNNTIDRQLTDTATDEPNNNINNTIDRQLAWHDVVYEEFKKELKEDDFNYVFKKSTELLTGYTTQKLYTQFGVADLWNDATIEVKEAYAALFGVILVEYRGYNRKADKYYFDGIMHKYGILTHPSVILSRTRCLFKCEGFNVMLNNKQVLSKVSA